MISSLHAKNQMIDSKMQPDERKNKDAGHQRLSQHLHFYQNQPIDFYSLFLGFKPEHKKTKHKNQH